jgi:hypothetical protein
MTTAFDESYLNALGIKPYMMRMLPQTLSTYSYILRTISCSSLSLVLYSLRCRLLQQELGEHFDAQLSILSVELFIIRPIDLLLRLAVEHSLESSAPARTSVRGNCHMERYAHSIISSAFS